MSTLKPATRRRAPRLVRHGCIAAVLVAGVAPAAAAPAFEALFAAYSIGSTPRLVVSADFDADGIADVAVSTFDPLAVTIRCGTGDGRLRADAAVLPTGTVARGLRVADFDRDGRPDLAVVGLTRVRVLRNATVAGVLAFTAVDVVVDAVDRRDCAAADFDGDGVLDLLVLEQSGFTTRAVVHRNDGTARFTAVASTDLFQDASWAALADFDTDGRMDLAVSGGALLGVFLGRGNGGFSFTSRYVLGRDVGPLVTGDFDADGAPDVAMGGASGHVLVCRGLGEGLLDRPWADTHGTDAVTTLGAVDATGDGRLDLFVVRQVANRIELLAGHGDATLAESARCATGLAPFGATVADLDADGRLDAIVCNSGLRSVAVILDQGRGWGRDVTVRVAPGPTALAAADLDRNGTPDLVTLHRESGDLAVCLGQGQAGFAPPQVLHVGGSPYDVALADLDADGRTDAILADPASLGLRWLRGDGAGGFDSGHDLRTGGHPETVAVADLDGDGHADLLAAEPGGAEQPLHFVSVLQGGGAGAFAPARIYELPSGAVSLAVADVDADGALDVVAACPQSDAVAFLLGNGDGTFRPAVMQPVGIRPASLWAADLDLDGRPEILAAHVGFRGISVLRYSAPGATVAAALATEGDARSVSVRDLDRDGWPDVIAIRALTGQLLVFPGGPGLGFASRLDLGAGNAAQVIAADANGDALADLLYPDALANAVVVLRNASLTTPVTITGLQLERRGASVHLQWQLAGDPASGVRAVQVERAAVAAGPWAAAGPELVPQPAMSVGLENETAASWYRVRLTLPNGAHVWSAPLYAAAAAGRTVLQSVVEGAGGEVRLAFELAQPAAVQWAAFDVRGRCVWRHREAAAAGVHELVWGRAGSTGERVRRGVYWVRMTAGGVSRTRRVVLRHS